MRPIFCGNFEFGSRASDLERLFKRYGRVDKVDMKSGFAFVFMDDERDAEYAIRALDRTEFGRNGRRLRVEWTKQEQGGRKPAVSRKSANLKPSKTLFVINFPYDTKERDIERHFDPYGKIINVRIRKNFAFVQYESLDDAIKALEATNMSTMSDRVISVEYSARGDDDKRNGHSPDGRGRDRSPDRRRRSPGPLRRERGSPDYGAGSRKERGSPDYGAGSRKERGSPEYGHGSSRSPRRVERGSPNYDHRKKSPSARRDATSSPNNGHGRSRSPPRRVERGSPDYDHRKNSPSSRHNDRTSPNIGRGSSRISRRVERGSPDYDHRKRSPSPRPCGGERNGNDDGHNPSPHHIEEASPGPDHGLEPRSPSKKPDLRRDSPTRAGDESGSPLDDSRSPVDRERSQS